MMSAAWKERGIALARAGKHDQAAAALLRACALAPGDPDSLYMLGRMLLQARKHRRAQAVLVLARAVRPGHAETCFYLGHSLGSLGRFADATGPLEDAVRLNPAWAAPASFLGSCNFDLERYDGARRWFLRAAALNPNEPDVHFILGRTSLRAGLRPMAAAQLDHAVSLDPSLSKSREFLLNTLSVQDLRDDLASSGDEGI